MAPQSFNPALILSDVCLSVCRVHRA